VEDVEIGAAGIRLGQLLKLVGIAGTGGEAKEILEAGVVTVNGRPEGRRGAQVHPGDVVDVDGNRFRIT
jgi:ribosome-associated protein